MRHRDISDPAPDRNNVLWCGLAGALRESQSLPRPPPTCQEHRPPQAAQSITSPDFAKCPLGAKLPLVENYYFKQKFGKDGPKSSN